MRMRAVIGVLVLALVLRLLRLVARWDEVAWLYAAYPSRTVDALARGDVAGALTEWSALHPPLLPLLHAATEIAAPRPLLWLGLSVAASWGAVALLARRDAVAALVLAVSPVAVHYAAEVNDYPLAGLWVALALVVRERWWAVSLAAAAAAWTHPLAGLVTTALVLARPPREAAKGIALLAILCLPLVPGVLGVLGDPGSFRQPPFKGALVAADVLARFGPLPLLWVPLMVLGARRARVAAAAWAIGAVALGVLIGLRIAAPHQLPYAMALAPLAAVILAGSRRGLVVALALAQGAWLLVGEGHRVVLLARGRAWEAPSVQVVPRAIDVALASIDQGWTCSGEPSPECAGDALYLLAPAGLNDDDKRRTSPVMWRLRPWWPMARVEPYAFDWGDHRHGQPRLVPIGGRRVVVYVNDHVRDEIAEAASAHRRLFVAVYEQGRREEYTTGLAALLGEEGEAVGEDRLYRLTR